MSNFQISILIGLAAWVLLCWLVTQFVSIATDDEALSDDERIDAARASWYMTNDGIKRRKVRAGGPT